MTSEAASETATPEAGGAPGAPEAGGAGGGAPPSGGGAPNGASGELPRLRRIYDEEVRPALSKRFGYENAHAVPRIEKVVLNMGVGEAAREQRKIDSALKELTLIAGQRAVATTAKNSIAGFKLREGQRIGCKATLRGARAYEFIDRLVNIALPRVRDFRGLSPKSFDGRGNFAFGLKEQITFPEIDYDSIDDIRGLDVIICTSAKTDDEARALLEALNFPFRER